LGPPFSAYPPVIDEAGFIFPPLFLAFSLARRVLNSDPLRSCEVSFSIFALSPAPLLGFRATRPFFFPALAKQPRMARPVFFLLPAVGCVRIPPPRELIRGSPPFFPFGTSVVAFHVAPRLHLAVPPLLRQSFPSSVFFFVLSLRVLGWIVSPGPPSETRTHLLFPWRRLFCTPCMGSSNARPRFKQF